MEYLKALARIVRKARTDCPAFGDMALHLAQSDMRAVARDGWQALTRSRSKNQDVLAWACEGISISTPDTSRDFTQRLLSGPDDIELTPRELALLDAHLKQSIDFSAIQRERMASPTQASETWDRIRKLRLIRDFNRNLQAAVAAKEQPAEPQLSAEPKPDAATKTNSPPALDSRTGFLGGAALANALGVHATRREAFFRQLERQRMSLGDDCWHEVREPRPNSPRFLYRADSPKLLDLAADYKNPTRA
jgi:hypothetical protein